jgi:uncharacterized protein
LSSILSLGGVAASAGPLELLVLQSTPFCNLDCDYCYLPNRDDSAHMDLSIIELAVMRALEGDIVSEEFTVVWHAGEPLVIDVEYYETAMARIRQIVPKKIGVHHSFQTNGVLINDRWCEFFNRHNVRLGLSIDGPAQFHDKHRTTRDGRPTHALVENALNLLSKHAVSFHVIAVVTEESIHAPDLVFDYLSETGASALCFNVEETEGVNAASSLLASDRSEEYRNFLERLHRRRVDTGSPIFLREVDGAISAILSWRKGGRTEPEFTQENTPFKILNVDVEGNFCTFSPELLGLKSETYGEMVLGNLKYMSLKECLKSAHYREIVYGVRAGVAACKRGCEYFELCGGGSPSNKLAENGRLDSSETAYCRLQKKTCIENGMNILESGLGLRASGPERQGGGQ